MFLLFTCSHVLTSFEVPGFILRNKVEHCKILDSGLSVQFLTEKQHPSLTYLKGLMQAGESHCSGLIVRIKLPSVESKKRQCSKCSRSYVSYRRVKLWVLKRQAEASAVQRNIKHLSVSFSLLKPSQNLRKSCESIVIKFKGMANF